MLIAPLQCTKMSPQHRKGFYVSYEFHSFIRFLEPLIGDLVTAQFADCYLDETIFSPLRGNNKVNVLEEQHELPWTIPTIFHLDPHATQYDKEVRRILDLYSVTQNKPDAFSDLANVTRLHTPAANVLVRIDVSIRHKVIPKRSNIPEGQAVHDGVIHPLISHLSPARSEVDH